MVLCITLQLQLITYKIKTMKTKYIWLLAGLIGLSSCASDDDNSVAVEAPKPPLTTGSADFSNFVSVGASFTAGFTDGALFKAGQESSFPKLMSDKFALIGGGSFTQPLMNDNTGGLIIPIPTVDDLPYRLIFNGSGPQRLNDFLTGLGAPVPPITTNAAVNLGSNFSNLGVPGLKSFHLTFPGYASANPYYGRFAIAAGGTVLNQATVQTPSFFSFSEIGGNDVLSYATSGGVGVDQTGNFNPASYGGNDITDPTVFKNVIDGALAALSSGGTVKGIVSNVPYVSSLPYFTTVPHNPLPLNAAQAAQLNMGYALYNGGITQAYAFLVANTPLTQAQADVEIAKRTITFEAGDDNALVLIDEDLRDLTGINPQLINLRQTTAADLITLPTSALIPTGAGSAAPLADSAVLTPEEQLAVKTATDAYNQHINDAVATNDLALVDFNGILQRASTSGLPSGQYILTTDLVTGGLVSLDGIHLTTRGYAVLANEMFKAIDAKYGTNFEASGNLFDPALFNTNYKPTLQ